MEQQQANPDILLPKGYLSYSQMTVWETNPERYMREYFLKGKKLDTKYLRFGKGIAKLIEELCVLMEAGDSLEVAVEKLGTLHNLTDGTKKVLYDLDTEGISEYEIRTVINGVEVLSFLDKYRSDVNLFREFKTGKIAWTQVKVQKHEQLPFYASALRAKLGEMPDWCYLDWIETEEKGDEEETFFSEFDKKINCTGKIKSFRRVFDERECDRMDDKILRVATEISDAYKAFINDL